MPKYGPHLPDIQARVQERLSALSLVPSYAFDPRKHRERFYTAPCRAASGKKVIFKMRTEDYAPTQQFFRREIRINELFTRFYEKSRVLTVPRFLDGDAESAPEWMVYEFIPGHEAGDFYNGLAPESAAHLDVAALVEGMRNMQAMSELARGEIALERETGAQFLAAYEAESACLAPFFSEQEIRAGQELLAEGRVLLDEAEVVVVHGDFHPGNIILKDGGGLAFIDWYDVGLSNAVYDLAYLLLEIPEEKLRRDILARFGTGRPAEEFYRLLRLDLLRLVPRKVGVLGDALFKSAPSRADYEAGLTAKGRNKLELNLEYFRTTLADKPFI
jgi:aminoglycoside phosphotransferase